MSKKNKKKSGKLTVTQSTTTKLAESAGFEILRPTAEGRALLNGNTVKRRGSKLTGVIQNTETVVEKVKEAAKKPPYDSKAFSKFLDDAEDFVKAGKYGKALEYKDRETLIRDFIAAIGELDPSDPKNKELFGMCRKFLAICKSYYEYDEQNREMIANATYDGLLATYLATGKDEPVGIIPKGNKNLQKVGIKYETLHNNVDKSYAVHKDDPIPDGVKESETVEGFLQRAYKELSMTPEMELDIEISPKLDGVSVNGTVNGDMLIDPQTRGDNEESVAVIGLNGMAISTGHTTDKPFGIQYEAFCTDEDRIAASKYLGLPKEYVSCRHAASGIIHRLCSMEDDKLLQFLSFYPIASEGLDGNYLENTDYIQNFGIVPEDMIEREVISGNFSELLEKITSKFAKFAEAREKLSYAIDGMVLTLVDDKYREVLGRSGRTNKFQIALKFDPANAEATVCGIHLDSGKKGFRTIQVDLAHPVFLDGVRYDHVPVLSARLYESMPLRKDSVVNVHRVGDVIPSITVVKEGTGKLLKLPTVCPDCGAALMIENQKLYCKNDNCSGNISGKFTGFFDKMGLDGYAESFADVLIGCGCTTLADMINATPEFFKEHGVKSKASEEFHDKLIQAIGEKPDYEILGVMGIPNIGSSRAKMILAKVPMDQLSSYTYTTLSSICTGAVGVVGLNAADVMTGKTFRKDLAAILPLMKNITKDFSKLVRVGHTGGKLSEDAIRACRQNHFEIVDGKSFDILITASMDRESGKMDVAKERKLPIFTDADFVDQYLNEDADDEDESEKKAS